MAKNQIAVLVCAAGFLGACVSEQSQRPEIIKSEVSRFIAAPIERVYGIVADVERHNRLLPNVVGREIVSPGPLISRAIKPNEKIALSIAAEPQDRLAITRFEFFPPYRIRETIVTNPFDEDDIGPLDKKKGTAEYIFEEVPGGTKFTARSEFAPSTGRFYSKAWIDGNWEKFMERLNNIATQPPNP